VDGRNNRVSNDTCVSVGIVDAEFPYDEIPSSPVPTIMGG